MFVRMCWKVCTGLGALKVNTMRSTWLWIIVVLVLIGAAACNRSTKSEAVQQSKSTSQRSGAPVALNPAPPKPSPFPEPLSPPKATPATVSQQAPSDHQKGRTSASDCEDIVVRSRNNNQDRFFPMPATRVREAAILALRNLDFKINRSTGREIEASRKRNFGVLIGVGGEKVLLHLAEIDKRGQRGTRVLGESKKGFVLRVGRKSWTSTVLAQMECLLQKDSLSR